MADSAWDQWNQENLDKLFGKDPRKRLVWRLGDYRCVIAVGQKRPYLQVAPGYGRHHEIPDWEKLTAEDREKVVMEMDRFHGGGNAPSIGLMDFVALLLSGGPRGSEYYYTQRRLKRFRAALQRADLRIIRRRAEEIALGMGARPGRVERILDQADLAGIELDPRAVPDAEAIRKAIESVKASSPECFE